jgi:hypothetical protein
MSRPNRIKWDDLPLFASDDEIGTAVLGPVRASEFRGHAALLEGQGFPKIDARMGGRYTPAVRRFWDVEYGLETEKPRNPRGVERPEAWRAPVKRQA